MNKYFRTRKGEKIPFPVFFPDATRAVLKTLDSVDIKNTKTPGILVNTFHLFREPGGRVMKVHKGVGNFMNWDGGTISDSGGFQVMSVVKSPGSGGKITDEGVTFKPTNSAKMLLTPEKSIEFQFALKTDMVVVLDDFTEPTATYDKARETVERTILWAKRSKKEYEIQCKRQKLTDDTRPYLLGVVQGGDYLDLRKECAQRLAEIGFDGFGYGGWPITAQGNFNYDVAKSIVENAPKGYLLYGLGIGKPEEVVALTRMGYHIFDCVLPTRDARHKRLYVFNAKSMDEIDLDTQSFCSYYVPDKQIHYADTRPVSTACDCHLCTNYSRSYLAHLFRIKEMTAMRLATIHNLRFYSLLMEKLREE
jgi:queuine tRNA-ribosyltransferase